MAIASQPRKPPTLKPPPMLKFCGSLPVAIVLMVVLIAVLIPATCVESW